MKQLSYLSLIILILLFSCEEEENKRPFGSLIEVPSEVVTIKGAIDIAQPYDTILLEAREYLEWDIKIDKPILLASKFLIENDSSLINQTIINANSESRVLSISDISDTLRIDGITIINGTAIKSDGGGIHCVNSNLKLTNMIIKDNIASGGSYMIGDGGGIYINESYIKLENVQILDNEATGWCGGIYCNNSKFYANNILIERSSSWGEPVTIGFIDSYIDIKKSIFKDNPSLNESYYNISFIRCNGTLEELKVINGMAGMTDSSIDLINCDIVWF